MYSEKKSSGLCQGRWGKKVFGREGRVACAWRIISVLIQGGLIWYDQYFLISVENS